MPYLLLGLGIVVGGFLLIKGLRGADPRKVVVVLKWTVIAIGGVGLLYLGVTGQLRRASYIAMGLLPFLMRWRALGRLARSWRGPTPGQSSDIETAYLRMRLDHDSGALEGTVLVGQFKGRLLQELSTAELVALLQECRVNDEQSAAILETYLDRVHGADWRGGGAGGSGGGRSAAGAGISLDEAYEVLGLEPGASPDAIREAHRNLMQKMHPDHGGSTYLAAKINQAKELLLGR